MSAHRIAEVAKRGMGPAQELAKIVPFVLRTPTAIFQGVREDGEAEWLCYCGLPKRAYRRESGDQILPYENEVYLVYVNADRVAYNSRWEDCHRNKKNLPVDYETRFDRRVL